MDSAMITGSCRGLRLMRGRRCFHRRHVDSTASTQAAREQAEARLRDRESIYGEFITEASRLAVDAADHSLEGPDKLINLYGMLGRIRLLAGERVVAEAEACCRRIVELYSMPNMTVDQVRLAVQSEQFDPLKDFSIACRTELSEFTNHVPKLYKRNSK